MTLDAYGRRRSSRSIPTGPGSRGGTPIDAAYFRRYRAEHPGYREREAARVRLTREARRDAVATPSFTDGLRDVVRREVERTSYRALARHLLVEHSTVIRFVRGHEPKAELVDALVAHFGIYRLVSDWRAQVRAARRAA